VVPASSETLVALPADVALHARPAATFVRAAMQFDADVSVGVDERDVDGKSLLSVLALGARPGTTLRLRADGEDANRAVAELSDLIAGLTE
jgi:phosphotransferase system HPr (HPr) family protein